MLTTDETLWEAELMEPDPSPANLDEWYDDVPATNIFKDFNTFTDKVGDQYSFDGITWYKRNTSPFDENTNWWQPIDYDPTFHGDDER